MGTKRSYKIVIKKRILIQQGQGIVLKSCSQEPLYIIACSLITTITGLVGVEKVKLGNQGKWVSILVNQGGHLAQGIREKSGEKRSPPGGKGGGRSLHRHKWTRSRLG